MKISNLKGYLLAAVAAAAYGTNPAFAIPLYDQGMNPNTVLLFRYMMGIPLLALVMTARKISFKMKKEEVGLTAILGILMAMSSLTLFESYRFMNSGIASTLLFVYPIMVAVMMIFFFTKSSDLPLPCAFLLMCGGLMLLMKPQGGESISTLGCLLVMMSALTYALLHCFCQCLQDSQEYPYHQTSLLCALLGMRDVSGNDTAGTRSDFAGRKSGWLNLMALAIIPTVLSLACTTRAIQLIGSTPHSHSWCS